MKISRLDLLFQVSGAAATKGAALLGLIILSHVLATDSYAKYAILVNIVTVIGAFVSIGFATLLRQKITTVNINTSEIAGHIRLCTIIQTIAAAFLILFFLLYLGELKNIFEFLLLITATALVAFISLTTGLLSVLREFRRLAVLNIISSCVHLFFLYVFAPKDYLLAIAFNSLALSIQATGVVILLRKHKLLYNNGGFGVDIMSLGKYALPATVYAMGGAPIALLIQSDVFSTYGAEQAAFLATAQQIANISQLLIVQIIIILYPVIAEVTRNKKTAKSQFYLVITKYIKFVIFAVGINLLITPFVLRIFSKDVTPSFLELSTLILTLGFGSFVWIYTETLLAFGKIWLPALMSVLNVIITLSSYFLIKEFGWHSSAIVVYALAVLFARTVLLVLQASLVNRYLREGLQKSAP